MVVSHHVFDDFILLVCCQEHPRLYHTIGVQIFHCLSLRKYSFRKYCKVIGPYLAIHGIFVLFFDLVNSWGHRLFLEQDKATSISQY